MLRKPLNSSLGQEVYWSICEAILNDYMFELPSTPDVKVLTIGIDQVEKKLSKLKLKAA